MDGLPQMDPVLSSDTLRQKAINSWNQRGKPDGKATLLRVLFHSLAVPFSAAGLPRLAIVIFQYSQPPLISRTIEFLSDAHSSFASQQSYLLVCAAIFVYFGLAVATSVYRHRINRLQVMMRGVITGLIHNKALHSTSRTSEEGRVATLVGTDVPGIETAGEQFHEMWGRILEFVVGVLFLASQVGWLWPLPLFMIFLGSRTSHYVARHIKAKQAAWNLGTQKRLSATSSMLGSIKNIKMLGLQSVVEDRILQLRQKELDMARRVRWTNVMYSASANALSMFAPVLTIVCYAAISAAHGVSLDTRTAFTTLAILSLVTGPANMIMTIVPQAVASWASFERIQAYLLEPAAPGLANWSADIQDAIRLEDVTISDPSSGRTILKDVNLTVSQQSVVICSGPVGSGKSSLTRAILGEIEPSRGTVAAASKRFAFCSQSSWLPNRSIKDCITGMEMDRTTDHERYEKSLKLCCLEQDLRELPDGDETLVGSMGLNLSGGQRQRVALARAVYSALDTVILDDSFSALDGRTEAQVVDNLLGPEGAFRKARQAVLWITNSTQYFPLADKIVILADSTIKEQGTWDSINSKSSQIAKMIHPEAQTEATVEHDLLVSQSQGQISRPNKVLPPYLDRRRGDLSLYGYYFRAIGLADILFFLTITAMATSCNTFPTYWLKWWTDDSRLDRSHFYIVGYIVLLVLAWTFNVGHIWSHWMRLAPRSGLVLHRRLLSATIGAPLLYFSENDSGVILNRFGQDIQLVDKSLALAFNTLCAQVGKIIMQVALLLAVQYYLAVSLPVYFVIVYVIQKVYLRTSRQLRIVELESRSAVYTSLLETIQGIGIIRAFGWQEASAQENTRCLDVAQQPFYLLLCLQRWLNVVLDLMVASIAVATIWLAVALQGTSAGSQVGVALNVVLVTNSTLVKLVSSWTDLEISLGAVARLKEVERDTPREEDPANVAIVPPENWPYAGEVEFFNMTAAYNSDTTVLRDIELRIRTGETVVVCGRTGSGKSSLLSSLLRLLEIRNGRVEVDGVDLSRLSLAEIRQRCFITVTQDPFLLPSAALRFNLDPSGTLPNSALDMALEKTGLRQVLFSGVTTDLDNHEEDHHPVFDELLSSLPALSVGQTQLLALARALLQMEVATLPSPPDAEYLDYPSSRVRKPIVLLDEVTSSLDPATEMAVYDVIEDAFLRRGHTVIMVTHKPGLFANRMRRGKDRVVWMRDGRIERVGDVQDLLGGPMPAQSNDPSGP